MIYKAFDINISSELNLPELLPGGGSSDLIIKFGRVPPTLDYIEHEGMYFQANRDEIIFDLTNTAGARYLVRDGSEIIVQNEQTANLDTVRLFLLDACLRAILFQRGLITLNGCAIAADEGAVIITGGPRVGKSTLGASLVKRGFRMLSDSICAVRLEENGSAKVVPGYPYFELWGSALEQLSIDLNPLKRVRPELEKYYFPADQEFIKVPIPLKKIIEMDSTIGFDPIRLPEGAFEKFNQINTLISPFAYQRALRPPQDWFKTASAIAKYASVQIISPEAKIEEVEKLLVERILL